MKSLCPCFILMLLISLFPVSGLFGHDTGPHYYLVRETAEYLGYTETVSKLLRVFNYYNDGFESAYTVMALFDKVPLSTDADEWGSIWGPEEFRKLSDIYMHFDGCKNNADLSGVWNMIIRNSYNAIQYAESHDDPLGAICVMGMTSHMIHDFYTHSNWASTNFAGGDVTWFDMSEKTRNEKELYGTGKEGINYDHDHLNKDHAGRPYYEKAYREAYYTTIQWFELIHSWTTPAFWAKVIDYVYHDLDVLDRELNFICDLSYYVGHWNGPQSLDTAAMVIAEVQDFFAIASNGTGLTQDYRTFHLDLKQANDLLAKWKEYAPIVTSQKTKGSKMGFDTKGVPMTIVYPAECSWMRVEYKKVIQTDNDTIYNIDVDIPPVSNEADFFAKTLIDHREYKEGFFYGYDFLDLSVSQTGKWIVLSPMYKNRNTDKIRLEVMIYDCDFTNLPINDRDDLCDINPAYDARTWVTDKLGNEYNSTPIETNGFRNDASWYESDGDGDEAFCQFVAEYKTYPRTPFDSDIHFAPGTTASAPGKPVIIDEGVFTSIADRIKFSFSVPGPGLGSNPVKSSRYRIREVEGKTSFNRGKWQSKDTKETIVLDWKDLGSRTSAEVPLTLKHGFVYYIDVKSSNAVGWSEVGTSDGIRADLKAPKFSVSYFGQYRVPAGLPPAYPPNSFEIEFASSEGVGESGLEGYFITIDRKSGTSLLEINKVNPVDEMHIEAPLIEHLSSGDAPLYKDYILHNSITGNRIILPDQPYMQKDYTYVLAMEAKDKAGNKTAVSAEFTLATSDTSAPSKVDIVYRGYSPDKGKWRIEWKRASDPESGIIEYQVALSTSASEGVKPDIMDWKSTRNLLWYEGATPAVDFRRVRYILVRTINGAGLTSISSYKITESVTK